MKKIKLFILILSISIFTTSCIENLNSELIEVEEEKIEEFVEEKIEQETIIAPSDEVILGMKRPKTLNPLTSNDITVTTALKLVFLDMVTLSDDNRLHYNLIESYIYDNESKTALIEMRNDVYWQDESRTVNADDLIFSLNTLEKAPNDAIYKNFYSNIDGYSKVNDYSVQINLKKPMAGLPYFLEFPIIPRHFFENYETINGVHFEKLVGNGLYKNDYNSINGDIVLVDNPIDKIDCGIETIRIKYIEDNEAMLYAFEQNKLDIIIENVQQWNKYHIDKVVNIVEYNNMEVEVLGFNFNREYLADINLRKAIEVVVPWEQIINTIYLGFCDHSKTILPTNHFAYNSDIEFHEENKVMAMEFLANSSYGGEQVDILVNNSTLQNEKVASLIVDNLREIGINAKYTLMDIEHYNKNINSGEFDVFIGTYKMSVLPDYGNLFGNNNKLGYNNEEVNQLIYNSLNASSVEEYKGILNHMQVIINNDLPIIPLFHKNKALISSKNIKVTKPYSYNNPLGNFDSFSRDRK